MPIVNYVMEHKAFIEYASDEGLSSSERLVWYGLFHIMNSRAKGRCWPDGFIRIPNERLLTYVPLGFDAMARARNRLCQRGLISFEKGRKNSAIPMYQMHYLTVPGGILANNDYEDADDYVNYSSYSGYDGYEDNDETVDNSVDNSVDNFFYPQKTDRTADKVGGKLGGKPADKVGGKPADININYININKDDTLNILDEEEEEEERAYARETTSPRLPSDAYGVLDDHEESTEPVCSGAEEKAMEEVCLAAIRKYFGRRGTPEEVRRIARLACGIKLDRWVVDETIRAAAEGHVSNLFAYLCKVYQTLAEEDIRTLNEHGEWRYLMDLAAGRIDGITHDVTDDLMELREKRKAAHREAGV